MKFHVLLSLILTQFISAQNLLTPYEKGNGNQSATYDGMVDFYDKLDKKFETLKIITYKEDDNGELIRVVIFSADKDFNFQENKQKSIILINNGIHPGEPDGIDATMMMMRDFATEELQAPKNVIIAAIECYNISGMLNRGKFSRANQNGPEEYGFRGNARNFDLNRDFIKTDSKNAWAFQEIFQELQPDYFIDNHVSNGADYQYVLTYITTNKERLGNPLAEFLSTKMQPEILKSLDENDILNVPYVNIFGNSPDEGFPAFMDSPRYATGYTSLFNVPGTVVETHMLKPYNRRVEATLEYLLSAIRFLDSNFMTIRELKKENLKQYKAGKSYVVQWKIDSLNVPEIKFKGYEAEKKPSEVSGKPRLFYNKNKPFERNVKFYANYVPTKQIAIPNYYVIPQSEWKTVQYLKHNNIKLKTLKKDSSIVVETYRISDFKTVKNPYEGHYLHYDTQAVSSTESVNFRKGDYLVSTDQSGVKYLLETLEPEAADSFFNWNFYDAILGQKEYFSDYVFEDTAAELLKTDKNLKAKFEKKKSEDPQFANDGNTQLEWIYKNSPYFEKSFRLYPVYRINEN
ncbi:MAG: hypothetical protein LBE36_08275 [Flavobacteriaceae bacterium]|jgi:hypothetical protein|nr:hypothetical protein [Flavobacteriaceae bacterium]